MKNKNPLIIYHFPCMDGFTAAYIAYREFGDRAEYFPGSYNQKDALPDVKDRLVYILDFSYPADIMRRLAAEATRIFVLDHHQSARDALLPLLDEGIISGEFDMDRSGAGMAWDWFNLDQPRLPFIDYVEDQDLWRFALPGSKQINKALSSYEYSFENWQKFEAMSIEDLRSEGNITWRAYMREVDLILDQAFDIEIGGVMVPAVNANYCFGSDVAGILAYNLPFAAYFWMNSEQKYVFGLRSTQGQAQAMDVAKIAEQYGGGGHKHASGFTVDSLKDL